MPTPSRSQERKGSPALRIDGHDWMELLTPQEIATYLSVFEQYEQKVLSIGREQANQWLLDELDRVNGEGGSNVD